MLPKSPTQILLLLVGLLVVFPWFTATPVAHACDSDSEQPAKSKPKRR
jgi:hypothetical protein